jgi:outer membrane receptor protein involved in Fe transport
VARTEAAALKPDQIVSVNVSKIETTNYVEVHTTAVRRVAMTGDSIVFRGDSGAPREVSKVEPLVIIDGVRSSMAALRAINKTGIASVEVIKGAAPMQQYGPDAAGGVIKVVTIAGSKQR